MSFPALFPDLPGGALCAETDPEAFFPEKGGSVGAAKQMCARCDVRAACLEWALSTGEPNGVWGGKSADERKRMRAGGQRRKSDPKPIEHGTERGYATHRRRKEIPCEACRQGSSRANKERTQRRAS